jgi:hypothetical protein
VRFSDEVVFSLLDWFLRSENIIIPTYMVLSDLSGSDELFEVVLVVVDVDRTNCCLYGRGRGRGR